MSQLDAYSTQTCGLAPHRSAGLSHPLTARPGQRTGVSDWSFPRPGRSH